MIKITARTELPRVEASVVLPVVVQGAPRRLQLLLDTAADIADERHALERQLRPDVTPFIILTGTLVMPSTSEIKRAPLAGTYFGSGTATSKPWPPHRPGPCGWCTACCRTPSSPT